MNWKVIATDPMDMKRIIKEYYMQLHGHRLSNTDEMVQFLE